MHRRDCPCLECRNKSVEFFAGFDRPSLTIPVCPTCGQFDAAASVPLSNCICPTTYAHGMIIPIADGDCQHCFPKPAAPAPSPQACERHAKLGLFEPCCDDCYKAEAAREAPADAPPATLVALRAEVARLQEELKQAQITLLLGRGRADELSSLVKLIVSWSEADAYTHRTDSGAGNWQSRAEKVRRAAELLESTLHLRETAEAEAQALRERIASAVQSLDSSAFSAACSSFRSGRAFKGDDPDVCSQCGSHERDHVLSDVLALLSPAQEAPK
jgi:hypothetical protein